MQATNDPYIGIRDEIAAEIQHITTLEAQLFSGRPEAKQQLKQAFQDVQEQLSALETAVASMVDNPNKFSLDPTTAFMRQVEVETLRFQLDDLQRTCGSVQPSSSSSREVEMHSTGVSRLASGQRSVKLPPPVHHSKVVQKKQQQCSSSSSNVGGGSSSSARNKQPQQAAAGTAAAGASTAPSAAVSAAGPSGWSEYGDDANGGWDQYEDVVQQQVLQQQDEDLDHISIHVDRIKQQGHLMHDELEQQALLLDGASADVDSSHMRLRGLRKKVQDVIKQSRHDRQLCVILVLSVLLVVLTVIALA